MNTLELKQKLQEVARILQNAQNRPEEEDMIKARQILNEVLTTFEGVSS
ncbi:MAG: hypothetical protein H0W64_04680 [Gammaproteobacteria bacterium]|nr:hypothetical protein [Gammaproteobacteria bacterium]